MSSTARAAHVALDRTVPKPVRDALASSLARLGLSTGEPRPDSAGLITTSAESAAQARSTVVLFDGHLNESHTPLLGQSPPVLLCAQRTPEGFPTSWELRMLAALWTRSALMPPPLEQVQKLRIGQVAEIQSAADLACAAVRKAGGGKAVEELAADVVHELAANALLDAPVGLDGRVKYAHQRSGSLTIDPEDACEVGIRAVSGRLYLRAVDRFGRLTPAPIANAVSGLGKKVGLSTEGGGAGLGMRRLLEHSDLLAVRVFPGKRCEVLCALDMEAGRRRSGNPKSVFFWTERENRSC